MVISKNGRLAFISIFNDTLNFSKIFMISCYTELKIVWEQIIPEEVNFIHILNESRLLVGMENFLV